ncbi:MAG: dihydrodipicolinate synthase family protein [Bacteroidales bacterium]|nr:dihydrodipicolinate synthase family protein [Bacteroidales bacterium]
MKKAILFLLVILLCPWQLCAADIEGPYLILSTPYNADGSVSYPNLVKEARYAVRWNVPGIIWPQSNDSVDLLSREERFEGMAALVREWKASSPGTRLVLGVNGDDTEDMLIYAREAERLAAEYGVDLLLAARPPYYGTSEADLWEYYDALAGVATRPVIIQTYVNEVCPTPTVDFLVALARKYPSTYGWIKEESNKLEANVRQMEELSARPHIKTVFSAWGGWQWLYQRRMIGTAGLVSERIAYAPIVSCIWKMMKDGDRKGRLTEAYSLYRLLIDQRFLGYDSLRGYSLYYFVRLGLFDNMLSRTYAGKPEGGSGIYPKGEKSLWKMDGIELTDIQKTELDKCYDDMMRFVKKYGR